MKKLLMFMMVAVMSISAKARANEIPLEGDSGTVRLFKGKEQAQVQMVREWVRMDVYPTYYTVAAQFVFKNHGSATAVRMCFPERNSEAAKKTGFIYFRAFVDGKRVIAKRVKVPPVDDWYGEDACWVKRVGFAKNGMRIVRVEYKSPARKISEGDRYVFYDFTGGGWAGKVVASKLRAFLHLPGSYIIMGGSPSVRKGNVLSANWKNWEADTSWDLSYFPAPNDSFIMDFDKWFPGEESAYILRQAGRANKMLYSTWHLCLKKNGILYSGLYDFYYYRYTSGENEYDADISYDKHTKVSTLSVLGKKFRFKTGRREMEVEGIGAVKLPAAPFLVPYYEENEKGKIMPGAPIWTLFVPLKPVADALGGRIEVDEKTSKVLLILPEKDESGKAVGDEK